MSREGKIHLVESFSGPRSLYKNVTTEAKYKSLVESARALHVKPKLTEAAVTNKYKKILKEAKVDEKMQKQILENLQESGANIDDIELWQFPVSKVNDKEHPNLNGRVYGKKLWENVVNNQRETWQGGTGLANHPADDEDGDFMKQSIVWLDGFIGDDNIIYGIGTFVGDGGALARQIIGVGGRVGFSTSGYGDFLADGVEVDPDDYEIDRFADLVLNPSQGVFGDHGDIMKKESVEKKKVTTNNKNLKESTDPEAKHAPLDDDYVETSSSLDTNDYDETDDPLYGYGEDDNLALSEKLVLDHYSEAIKAINKESNKLWEEKIQKLKNLVTKIKKESFSASSKEKLSAQISNIIESIMKDTRKAIQEGYDARAICEELEISNISKLTNIKEKLEDFTSLEECLEKVTKEANKYKAMCESKEAYAINEAEENFNKEEQVERLSKQVVSLKKSLTESNTAGKDLKKQLFESKKFASLTEAKLNATHSTIDTLREQVKTLRNAQQTSKKESAELTAKVVSLKKELAEETSKKEELIASKKSLLLKNRQLTEQYNELKSLFEEADKTVKQLQKASLKSKLNFAESKIETSRLTNELNSIKEREEKLREKHIALRATNAKLKNDFNELEESAKRDEKALKMLKAKNTVMEAEAKSLNANLLKEQQAKAALEVEKKEKLIAEKKAREEALREERLAKVRSRLQAEAQDRKEALREAEFYDENDMFRESDEIDQVYEDYGIDEADREAYGEAKTAEEAFNNVLFSNELLDDEAESERAAIRAPVDTPTTLADMFN